MLQITSMAYQSKVKIKLLLKITNVKTIIFYSVTDPLLNIHI